MERFIVLHKETDYSVIDNGIFRDKDLSLAEVGLLCTVLSLPENWDFKVSGLQNILKESTPTIRRIIKSLIDHGYCKLERLVDDKTKKVTKWEYTFFEVKYGVGCGYKPQSNIPQVENPQSGVATSGNVSTIKYLNNKVLKNKVKNNNPPISPFDFLKALRDLGVTEQLAREWMAVRKTKRLTNTRTAFDQIAREIAKTGRPATDCVRLAVENSWGGFKAEWMKHETQHVTLDNLDETIRRLNDGTYTG
jgi:hypothetical protein